MDINEARKEVERKRAIVRAGGSILEEKLSRRARRANIRMTARDEILDTREGIYCWDGDEAEEEDAA